MNSNQPYATVKTFDTAINAWIFANRLSDFGLNPILINEHTVAMIWIYSTALGGIQVKIPINELATYQSFFQNSTPDEKPLVTKARQSAQNRLSNTWPKQQTVTLLIVFVLYLIGASIEWFYELPPASYCTVGEFPWLE